MEGLGTPRDYVEAYKWFSLAGITRNRDEVAKKMAEDQITEGRERAKAWAKDDSLPTKNCLSTTSNSPIRSSRLARYVSLIAGVTSPLHSLRVTECKHLVTSTIVSM